MITERKKRKISEYKDGLNQNDVSDPSNDSFAVKKKKKKHSSEESEENNERGRFENDRGERETKKIHGSVKKDSQNDMIEFFENGASPAHTNSIPEVHKKSKKKKDKVETASESSLGDGEIKHKKKKHKDKCWDRLEKLSSSSVGDSEIGHKKKKKKKHQNHEIEELPQIKKKKKRRDEGNLAQLVQNDFYEALPILLNKEKRRLLEDSYMSSDYSINGDAFDEIAKISKKPEIEDLALQGKMERESSHEVASSESAASQDTFTLNVHEDIGSLKSHSPSPGSSKERKHKARISDDDTNEYKKASKNKHEDLAEDEDNIIEPIGGWEKNEDQVMNGSHSSTAKKKKHRNEESQNTKTVGKKKHHEGISEYENNILEVKEHKTQLSLIKNAPEDNLEVENDISESTATAESEKNEDKMMTESRSPKKKKHKLSGKEENQNTKTEEKKKYHEDEQNEYTVKKGKKHKTQLSENENNRHSKKQEEKENGGKRKRSPIKFKIKLIEKKSVKEEIENNEDSDTSIDEKIDEDDKNLVKLARIYILVPWTVPPLHLIETRVAGRPTPEQRKDIEKLNITVRSGNFTKQEDEMIKNNFREFCKTNDLPEDPTPFLNFSHDKRVVMPTLERIKFVRCLAHDLNDRLLFSVYQRFQRLFRKSNIKSGRFTGEEDTTILQYMESTSSSTPFSDLAKTLNRDKLAVEKRFKKLNQVSANMYWTKEQIADLLKIMLTVVKCNNVEELKDRNITSEEWKEISFLFDVPVEKLRRAWLYTVYHRVFLPKSFTTSKIKTRLIRLLIENGENDWRGVSWDKVAKHFEGFSGAKLNKMLKETVVYHVPPRMQDNLGKCLKFLSEKSRDIKFKGFLQKLDFEDEVSVKLEEPDLKCI